MRRSNQDTRAFLNNAAGRMRFEPTRCEAIMRPLLESLGFIFQHPIQVPKARAHVGSYPYVLDFYHPGAKICVEIDGSVHRRTAGRDRRRDSRLAAMGIFTIRISNQRVLRDRAAVVAEIQSYILD